MELSIFTDKAKTPTNDDLICTLGGTYDFWETLRNFVFEKYPSATEGWNYPGKKYGWSFRIKDKKRAIIYLLPRENHFLVAFVFGQKATRKVLESKISTDIKSELENARVYAEGRGIRIEIKDDLKLGDIKELVKIKIDS